MKLYFIPTLALAWLVNSAFAQDKPDLTDPKQKTSYALGMDIVSTLRQEEVEVDLKALAAGVADTLAGKPALSAAQQKDAMESLSKDMVAKAEARSAIIGARNLTDGRAFLAANAQKAGVMVTNVIAPDGSSAELQYQILKSGAGSSPKITDIVEVNYVGSLINGMVFDSSLRHGTAPTFGMKQVIPGWTAALQMMKAGDKWRLFIPPGLAYGESAPPQIGPNSTIIYDLELVSFYTPTTTNSPSIKPPAPALVK